MEGMSSSGGLEIGISCFTEPHFRTEGQKHTHQCTWLLLYELLSQVYSGVCLGRVYSKIIWMVGWALCPSLILGWYQAFCVLMFLSGLAPLCLWIHFILFCTQGFAIPTNYIFMLRDTDQTLPLMNHFSNALLLTVLLLCSISGTSLPRSTVSLILSSTLNQASTTTSHSSMPSRGNGKFTCLGFVRGCLMGLALLIRFLDLWFVE